MTIETACIAGSILASVVSVGAVLGGRTPQRLPGRTVTITIEDPVSGMLRTMVRSTRRAEQIRHDVERAIRDGG